MPKSRTVGPHPKTGQIVDRMSSEALRQQLVADALAGYPTDLAWFTAAVQRIADLDKIELNEAIEDVWCEVRALGGFMPGLA